MTKSKTAMIIPDEIVVDKIYLIRGQKVMLDSDLAELYGIETKSLKRAVKRNATRFPDDFVFQLTKKGIRKLEVPNWHLKFKARRSTIFTLCLYRTGCGH